MADVRNYYQSGDTEDYDSTSDTEGDRWDDPTSEGDDSSPNYVDYSARKNKFTRSSQFIGGVIFPVAKLTEGISSQGSQWSQGADAVLSGLPCWALFHGLFQIYESYLLVKKVKDSEDYLWEEDREVVLDFDRNYSSQANIFKAVV